MAALYYAACIELFLADLLALLASWRLMLSFNEPPRREGRQEYANENILLAAVLIRENPRNPRESVFLPFE